MDPPDPAAQERGLPEHGDDVRVRVRQSVEEALVEVDSPAPAEAAVTRLEQAAAGGSEATAAVIETAGAGLAATAWVVALLATTAAHP